MNGITLTIYSNHASREQSFTGDRLVIGRAGEGATDGRTALLIDDAGLAPRHASINREGQRIWVLDEGSPDGTFVNDRPVPPRGLPLADGDQISLGEHTFITIHLDVGEPHADEPHDVHASSVAVAPSSRLSLAVAVGVPALVVIGLLVFSGYIFGGRNVNDKEEAAPHAGQQNGQPAINSISTDGDRSTDANSQPPNAVEPPALEDIGAPDTSILTADTGAPVTAQPAHGGKLYLQMSQAERLVFLEQRAQHISMLMGNRPYAFNDEVLGYIKKYVDVYASRVGNNSQRMWGEDLRFVFGRARTQYAPHITRAFNARNVPPVVGLYIVMIETEYHNIRSENFAGAAGLFQFIGPTARAYGVDPSERTNVEKMAPAAARYMADRIAEFGPDSMSVALAIAGYNRSPDSVRRDLRDVLNSNNKERSFWTLVANSDKLDHYFQNENIKYVPKFFAAAIVGENPEAFGLEMRKLSTYTVPQTSPPGERTAGAQASETAP